VYTSEARAQRIEGIVTVEAAFDIDGNFTVLRVVNGLGYGLDESALASLRTWRFAPADRNASRVPVVARIEVPFRLVDDAHANIKRMTEQLEAYKAKVKAIQEREQ
jgi:protein TonB